MAKDWIPPGGVARLLHLTLYTWWLTLHLACTSSVGQVAQRTHRLHPVRLKAIKSGRNWVWVSWAPGLARQDVHGQLNLTLFYRWSDPAIPDKDNTVYLTPSYRLQGRYPTNLNITDPPLLANTWYSVCLNATHVVSSKFSRVSFTCMATKTLTAEGKGHEPFKIISDHVSIRRGATWAELGFTVMPGPYRVVQWEIFLEDGGETNFYTSRRDDGRRHSFLFTDLKRDTDYQINVRLSYAVDVKDNDHVEMHIEYLFFTTLVSGSSTMTSSSMASLAAVLLALGFG